MAFTGTAVFTTINSGRTIRVTGLTLAAGADGGFALASQDPLPADSLALPGSFNPKPYSTPDAAVSVNDSVSIRWTFATTVAAAPLVSVAKAAVAADPLFLVTNDDAAVTSEFEFTIDYKG